MGKRQGHLWFWIKLLLIGVAVGGLTLFYLDLKIRTKFEAHRWNLPSRIYSDSYYLFPGRKVSSLQVERKLGRLAYKRVYQPVRNPGEFYRQGSELNVYLHNFSYPAEEFAGFRAKLRFKEGELIALENLESDQKLSSMKLEPELVASIFDEKMEDRTVISLDQIPEELTKAVIAIEDERFYSHFGVDPIAIVRALLTDLLQFKFVQGGSTLTQQLVKNYFLSPKKSIFRKFNEFWMAILLERRYSKEEILEAYLNEIYFGQRGPVSVTGIEEAARLYFSKSASQLTLAESALLAGMIRAPGEYNPLNNRTSAYDRRNFVLKTMLDKEMITKQEFQRAKQEKIIVAPPSSRSPLGAPFFVEFLKTQLQENYGDILSKEGLRIFTTLDSEAQEIAEAVLNSWLDRLERDRPPLKKVKAEGKRLEGALIALQPQTGYLRAYVGGRNYQESQFDHLSMAHRQPGSAFKPFVYLTALAEEGEWTLATPLEDKSFSMESGGEKWEPKNYDEKEHGMIPLREALEQSYNLATARLAIEVGLEKIVAMARKAGIDSPLDPYPSLALGSFEVVPLELARAYTIFPNNGIRSEPIAFTSVVTRDNVVLEKKSFKMNRVIPHSVAYLMNSLLKGVVERGTATAARAYGYDRLGAGKTGTTSDYRDSWFVGYTPELLALSWVGYDDGTETGLSGASGGLPIWSEFMKRAAPVPAADDFLATDKILLVKIDRKSGKLADRRCGESFEELFIRGTEPKGKCHP